MKEELQQECEEFKIVPILVIQPIKLRKNLSVYDINNYNIIDYIYIHILIIITSSLLFTKTIYEFIFIINKPNL